VTSLVFTSTTTNIPNTLFNYIPHLVSRMIHKCCLPEQLIPYLIFSQEVFLIDLETKKKVSKANQCL
jgi:hypothetical protein